MVEAGIVPSSAFNQKKAQVFGELGKGGPAVSYNYSIGVQKGPRYINLIGGLTFSHPSAGVSFTNKPEFGYKVTAELEELTPVEFVYWDTAAWEFTQMLNNYIYEQQFVESGLLAQDYATAICTIEFGPLTRTYYECAISKPVPQGGSSSNSLLQFSFTLAYNRFEDTYNDVLL